MPSSNLRLRAILNNPATLDLSKDWIPLNSANPPTLLVYGSELAKLVLKADTIGSYNLVTYWKLVSKLEAEKLPAVETFFEKSPLFLYGDIHANARKQLAPIYKKVEAELDSWLPSFCNEFFNNLWSDQGREPVQAVNNFLELLAKQMIARYVGDKALDLPKIPSKIFQMLLRPHELREYDQQLEALIQATGQMLIENGQEPEGAWGLVSISVMGREPLTGTLLFAMLRLPKDGERWNPEALLHESAPVDILGREVLTDCTIADLQLKKGQLIDICPYLIHLKNESKGGQNSSHNSREQTSFSFGFGGHICPGRKITLKIVREFLRALNQQPAELFDTSKAKLVRDFILSPSS
jgi:cytochrome P450